jgi:hypothetical protein
VLTEVTCLEPRNQLLEFGIWPTTYKEPQSGVTFNLLRNFHIMNLKGRIPPTDYYHALTRMSDGDGLCPPPVSIFCDESDTFLTIEIGSICPIQDGDSRMATH